MEYLKQNKKKKFIFQAIKWSCWKIPSIFQPNGPNKVTNAGAPGAIFQNGKVFIQVTQFSRRSSLDHGLLPGPDLANRPEAEHSELSTGLPRLCSGVCLNSSAHSPSAGQRSNHLGTWNLLVRGACHQITYSPRPAVNIALLGRIFNQIKTLGQVTQLHLGQ